MKMRKPNLPCTEITLFFEHFYEFFFVVWPNSGHFWGVYHSHYCVSEGAFLFSFVYGMYVNIVSYLYGKQINSKLRNKLYLRMIFICVPLNLCYLCECRTMILEFISNRSNDDLSFFYYELFKKYLWVACIYQVTNCTIN